MTRRSHNDRLQHLYRRFANDEERAAAKWEERAKEYKAKGFMDLAIRAARMARDRHRSANSYREKSK